MGSITSGIGLISGLNTAAIIDALLAVDSRPKILLQTQVASLQQQRAALLDINSRLLNFMSAAKAFREQAIFGSALATSSDEDVLTAQASVGAPPGTYKFIVRQLLATSQKLSRGFADADQTPLGLTSLSFELGRGGVAPDTDLANLNGGAGVDRGRILVTDRAGDTATIDLTDVTTLSEVSERINGNGTALVTASIAGDHLVLTDTSGGAGPLVVASSAGDTTAEDLGIDGSVAGAVLTGADVNFIGADTTLASLNDGTGVLIEPNVADFRINASDGSSFDIDLSRIDQDITGASLIAELNNGAGVTLSSGADIEFVDRDGTAHEVELSGSITVQDLIDRVATQTGGAIVLSIESGDRLKVTDTTGGSGLLKIRGTDEGGDQTAQDLGILNEDGVAAAEHVGTLVPYLVDQASALTVQDVIDRINSAQDTLGADNAGRIVASITPGGSGLTITDTTGATMTIAETASNGSAAAQLGILSAAPSAAVTGRRLIASLGSVLLRSLNGGSGVDLTQSLTLTDRQGDSTTLSGLDGLGLHSLEDLVDTLNTQLAATSVDVTVAMNDNGNGLMLSDDSGGSGTLIASGLLAEDLGLDTAGTAADTHQGRNLQLAYVSVASRLADLNYGRGVGTGTFRITDASGATAEVTIGGDEVTLFDVIQEINSRGLDILARVNDTGDGLLIESTLAPEASSVKLKVESVGGSAAGDLNIIGESGTVEDAVIDGSYERSIDVTAADTLETLAEKINDAGVPVSAAVLNTGSGPKPYRLSLTSAVPGALGELVVDGGSFDLGLTTLARGRDAKVFFGADQAADAFLLTSRTGSLAGVVPGLTVDLHDTSEEAVTVTVSRDQSAIVEAVRQFTTAFNDVITVIDTYDFFNVESEQKGVLLGSSTTAGIRAAMLRAVQQPATGVSSSYRFLSQVGIRIGSEGQLQFDEAKFEAAYAQDPEAVESLFAAFDATTGTSVSEIAPGVTISESSETITSQGFGEIFAALADRLTNALDGTLTRAQEGLDDRIELLESRIEDMDDRLAARRQQLERQFAAMELALANLQNQSNALLSLTSNLALAQSQALGRSALG